MTATIPHPPPEASGAVLEWLQRLAAGDMAGAWELLGPTAREGWGSYETFAAARTDFAEGMATWLTADNRAIGAATLERQGTTTFHVVTITGTRRVEGSTEDGALAVVVREQPGDRFLVEPFSPASAALTITPAGPQPSTVPSSEPVTLQSPTTGGDAFLVLERDHDVVPVGLDASGSATFRPPGGWSAGRHVVTAVVITRTGAPMAAAVVFHVA